MKIHITMNDRLVEKVDKAAAEIYTSRSGFISFACAYYLQTMNNKNLPDLLELVFHEWDGKEIDKK